VRLLIVEDDENKRNRVVEFVTERFPRSRIAVARSFQGGMRSILEGGFDLVILDMTMPTFDIGREEDGGRPQPYAGREILRRMDRHGINTPVVVLTQFDRFGVGADVLTLEELDSQLRESHGDNYRGAVYYNVALEGWKEELARLITAVTPAA
jgi:DNA-binding NarL/FixJ family response regulator